MHFLYPQTYPALRERTPSRRSLVAGPTVRRDLEHILTRARSELPASPGCCLESAVASLPAQPTLSLWKLMSFSSGKFLYLHKY